MCAQLVAFFSFLDMSRDNPKIDFFCENMENDEKNATGCSYYFQFGYTRPLKKSLVIHG